MGRAERTRLDEALVARGLAPNRSAARGIIMAGLVTVSGKVSDKAGTAVADDAEIVVKQGRRYVSRGGEKLAHALDVLDIDVEGTHALDVGASTGGFVDCLLQRGATEVIALDVGRGQLDGRLREDGRVHVIEKVNARHLTSALLPYSPDFLTMDVSFISVVKVLPSVMACLQPAFEGLILIKPQFEAGVQQVGKGGIVRDEKVHRAVLMERAGFIIEELRIELLGMCSSGLAGADGNVEFFLHVGRGREEGVGLDRLEAMVEETLVSVRPPGMGSVT